MINIEQARDELLKTLEDIITLLDADGNEHWLAWMRDARDRITNWDISGIEQVLAANGGMGSFNDLIIGQMYDGETFAWKPGARENNDRLDGLRSRVFQLASKIRDVSQP